MRRRVTVVTGAGRGIGKAIASRLAEESARVVINNIDLAYAENLVERRFSGVDILVNWDSAITIQSKGFFNGKIITFPRPVPASPGEQGQTSYAAASVAIDDFRRFAVAQIPLRAHVKITCHF